MPLKPKIKKRPWEPKKDRTPFARRVSHNKSFYNSAAWKLARANQLFDEPYCQCDDCKRLPVPLDANTVDHIIPINQGGEPLDPSNFKSMNSRCHNRKSGREAHR